MIDRLRDLLIAVPVVVLAILIYTVTPEWSWILILALAISPLALAYDIFHRDQKEKLVEHQATLQAS